MYKLWNAISPEIKQSRNLNQFKQKLHTIDFSPFYNHLVFLIPIVFFPFFIRLLTFSPVSLTYMTETELCSRSKRNNNNKQCLSLLLIENWSGRITIGIQINWNKLKLEFFRNSFLKFYHYKSYIGSNIICPTMFFEPVVPSWLFDRASTVQWLIFL